MDKIGRGKALSTNSLTPGTKEAHIIVKGLVQGVGFRFFAFKEAQRWHIKGWVRNKSDGSVELKAQGENEALKQFLKALKEGPPASIVEEVLVNYQPISQEYFDFKVIR